MTLLRRAVAGMVALAVAAGVTAAPIEGDPPAAAVPAPAVIPAPAEVVPQSGVFALREGTAVWIPPGRDARRTADYLVGLVRSSHGLSLHVHVRDARARADGAIAFALTSARGSSAESYQLEVSPTGILISAGNPRGLFYGAVTLWQLISAQPLRAGAVDVPSLTLRDTPRFRWRGLMLDSARHFQSPAFVMRFIDWMAVHKLNVLSWHLTDDQGWRLEIKRYPRLTQVGAWRVEAGEAAHKDIDPASGRPRLYGGFYTQAQVRRIVEYAAARNVTIVPEIDMPGHATAAIVAYRALASTPDPPRAVPADWGIYPNLFNVDESTFAFLEGVLAEVMQLFPGEYVHVGGDEAVKDQWRASARVQARMRELGVANEEALQGYFTHRLGQYLTAHGRRLIGWDEILAGGLPPAATVMSWRGVDGAIAAAAGGHDTVLSPAPTLYLDNRQGAGPDEPPGRGEVITLRDVYSFDPLPAPLAAQQQHVLGVQANLWTEHVGTEERTAYMTWPRAAALAEVGWSRPGGDWQEFVRRLPAEFDRLRALGVRYSADVFAPPRTLTAYERHMSQDLGSCSGQLLLNLEAPTPLAGERATFLVDIENPCWIFPAADLSQARHLTAAVGRVPFNFQLGADRDAIRLAPPHTAAGELEVFVDRCEGQPLISLPLAPASGRDGVTALPAAALSPVSGTHALCLRFTQRTLDPLWVIDWVQLSP